MRLILLRHAKSDWNSAALGDKARPLNARGKDAAPKIGAWIAARVQPDHVLVSSAVRTQETWARLGLPGTPEVLDALYLAEPGEILAELPEAGRVLVIGHNPGIADAAERLAAALPDHPDFLRYPTGACTILDFEGPAEWRKGRVVDFAIPRDL